MKKYLLGVCAIALALSFSAFRAFVPNLSFVPANITEANVDQDASWTSSSQVCPAPKVDPCIIDLALITSQSVTNEAQFLSYLATFPNDAARVAEVQRITVDRKP